MLARAGCRLVQRVVASYFGFPHFDCPPSRIELLQEIFAKVEIRDFTFPQEVVGLLQIVESSEQTLVGSKEICCHFALGKTR